jgi:polyferredoxin
MQEMKMLIRGIICAMLSAALSISFLPVEANAAPATKSDCCAKKQVAHQHKGCAKDAPKSVQDEQCCATCFACVAVVPGTTLIPKRPESEQSYLNFSQAAESRAQRPPVPPPRKV